MTVYRVTTTFGFFRFEADLTQAAAPIWSLPDRDDEGDEGGPSPYQTADARHDEQRAAVLVLDYYGPQYWLDPAVERNVEDDTFAGLAREEYVASLIVSVEAE